jgi:hypothetical protein
MPKLMAAIIECGIEEYRIRVGDRAGQPAEYGDPATVSADGYIYSACVHETDSGKRISLLPGNLWIIKGVAEPCSFTQYDETAADGDGDGDDSGDEEESTDDEGDSEDEGEGDDDEEANDEDDGGDSDSDDSEEEEDD